MIRAAALPMLLLAACGAPTPAGRTLACAPLAEPRSVVSDSAPDYMRAHEDASICVKRNAYDMAASPDPAEDVAAAAVAACLGDIRTYAVMSAAMLNEVRADPSLTPDVRPSVVERDTRADMRDVALAAVMRTRAANCHR